MATSRNQKFRFSDHGVIHAFVAMDLAPFFSGKIRDHFDGLRVSGAIARILSKDTEKFDSPGKSFVFQQLGHDLGVFSSEYFASEWWSKVIPINTAGLVKYIDKLISEIKPEIQQKKHDPKERIKYDELEITVNKGLVTTHALYHTLKKMKAFIAKKHISSIDIRISDLGIGLVYLNRSLRLDEEKSVDPLNRSLEFGSYMQGSPFLTGSTVKNAIENILKIRESNDHHMDARAAEIIANEVWAKNGASVYSTNMYVHALVCMHYYLHKTNFIKFLVQEMKPSYSKFFGKNSLKMITRVGTSKDNVMHSSHIVYQMPNICILKSGKGGAKPFNCPLDPEHCPDKKKAGNTCLIDEIGHKLQSILDGAALIGSDPALENFQRITFPILNRKYLNDIGRENMASWVDELALIGFSKSIFITSNKEIVIDGRSIRQNDYWSSISTAFSRFLAEKASLKIILNNLFQIEESLGIPDSPSITSAFYPFYYPKKIGLALKKAKTVSLFLGRLKFTRSPILATNAEFTHKKLDKLVDKIGSKLMLQDAEKALDRINSNINNFVAREISSKQAVITIILSFLAVFFAFITIILTFIAFDHEKVSAFLGKL